MNKRCRCGRFYSIKISKLEKNRNKLYYDCDVGCGFISCWAPVSDLRGYSTEGIDNYVRDEQPMAMARDTEKQEINDEIKRLSSKLEVLEIVVSTLKMCVSGFFFF